MSIRVGDVGTVIEVTLTEDGEILDVSNAENMRILLRGPSEAIVSREADFTSDGKDGKIRCTTQDGDINRGGYWQVRAYIELGGGKFTSSSGTFDVEGALSA